MSINRLSSQDVSRSYIQGSASSGVTPSSSRATGASADAGPNDQIQISEEGRSLAIGTAAVRSAPEVRDEAIARGKQIMQSGSYDKPQSVRRTAERLREAITAGSPF